jgi:very-short-patch-repair endonuclease
MPTKKPTGTIVMANKLARFKSRALQLRKAQTSAEARLWQALRNRKLAHWKFRRQHPIDRFVVDFVTIDGKLVIEVDGVTHGSHAAAARDAERTAILESLGFHVVRVTNTDVYEHLDGVLEMIDSTVNIS